MILLIYIYEDFIKYNANSKDRDTSDCVKRSLSLAYNMDYNRVASELRKIRRDTGETAWNIAPVYGEFMKSHGLISKEKIKDQNITVGEFSDNHKSGIYVIRCYKGRTGHLTTIIDGDIYDTWDCSSWMIDMVYTVSKDSVPRYNSDDLTDRLSEYALSRLYDEVAKYDNKLPSGKLSVGRPEIGNYGIGLESIYRLKSKLSDGTSYFDFSVNIKLNPRYGEDENKSLVDRYIANATKHNVKMALKYIKDLEDTNDITGGVKSDKFVGDFDLLLKLPIWCRELMTSLRDNGRGNWYRYTASMIALPKDPRRKDEDTVSFYADTWNELKDQIDIYKNSYKRYNYDY